MGWSRQRRVVLLRRKFNRPLALLDRTDPGQPLLGFAEVLDGKREVWEYAALVTSLDSEILSWASSTVTVRIARTRSMN